MYHKLIQKLAARASIIEKRLEKNETRRRIREEKNEYYYHYTTTPTPLGLLIIVIKASFPSSYILVFVFHSIICVRYHWQR